MDQLAKLILFLVFIAAIASSSNIESSGDGSFCIVRPPKRAILSNCTSSEMCERLLDVSFPAPPSYASPILQCGDQGECVSNLYPGNEHCKTACESSHCSSLCLQLYETKNALYCIETRDHPNALPPNSNKVVSANKYYCTCILPNENQFEYHHKVVGRHLK